MEIDINKKTLNAKINKWDFEADYIGEKSIKIFIYSQYYYGNKFIGFYNPENETIRPLYYNSHIDYRNGWQPTKKQFEIIKKYCNKLIKTINNKNINNYQKRKEETRQQAIEWQQDFEKQGYCWGDLIIYQQYFEDLGKKYGLLKEFHENGIC
jgi:hypothetical protein